uniref:Uncharacterized protein n=1 Tax=Alexandrium catenella TaxID=2925 RepID=A0A7S1S2J0_ALECA
MCGATRTFNSPLASSAGGIVQKWRCSGFVTQKNTFLHIVDTSPQGESRRASSAPPRCASSRAEQSPTQAECGGNLLSSAGLPQTRTDRHARRSSNTSASSGERWGSEASSSSGVRWADVEVERLGEEPGRSEGVLGAAAAWSTLPELGTAAGRSSRHLPSQERLQDSPKELDMETQGSNCKAKKRPCKEKRERYKSYVLSVQDMIRADPHGFDIGRLAIPPFVSTQERLTQKFIRRMRVFQRELQGPTVGAAA